MILSMQVAYAFDVPEAIQEELKEDFPKGEFRVDGIFQNGKDLWIPLIPRQKTNLLTEDELLIDSKKMPDSDEKILVLAKKEGEKNALSQESEMIKKSQAQNDIKLVFTNDDRDYMFSNGWIYTPIF